MNRLVLATIAATGVPMAWVALMGAGSMSTYLPRLLPPGNVEENARSSPLPPSRESGLVHELIETGMFELQLGELAEARAGDPAIRSLAEAVRDEHADSIRRLKMAIRGTELQMAVPTELDRQRAQRISMLEKTSAAEFDRSYLIVQLDANRDEVGLIEGYSRTGVDRSLADYAKSVRPPLSDELRKTEQVRARLPRSLVRPASKP